MAGHETLTATLSTVAYGGLVQGHADELATLRRAFSEDGFVYLDLGEQEGDPGSVFHGIEAVFTSGAEFFSTSLDEKMRYDVDAIGPYKLHGYKPAERNGGIAENKKDGVEAYVLPRDGICDNDTPEKIHLPPAFQGQRALIKHLLDQLHSIGLVLLKALDNTGSLTSRHRPDKTSTSCLGVLRYPSLSARTMHTGQGAHTDVGSLTILFCRERGLQVLDPRTEQWRYVEPRAGCAVINVGDSLRFLSGGALRSSLHRVVPYPGVDIQDRASCAYFMRPELDSEFVDDSGRRWASLHWHMRKYRVYRSSAHEQKRDTASSTILTGKPSFLGFWEEERSAVGRSVSEDRS
ncbi:Clavaminate synthase [Achaetomium macrosporum]|uniref:Clavaminate synthase n=1 Tax=Achaetomium macrosporum TaxID=79813 RepID=A0AAN7C6D8_9PEZI|nr:Clavaminate synthase [Achaetomium macrosporum]